MRLWHSRTCATLTVTVVPLISTTSCDQSNWYASPAQSSAAQRLPPSRRPAWHATSWRIDEPRRSCPRNRGRVAPRISGSASAARAPACPRSPAADRRAGRATDQSAAAAACPLIAKLGRLRPDHLAHHPSRHPKLAANRLDRLVWAKYARRIFAIVSTTSIPNLAPVSPTEATVDPPSRGSRLDADRPENGVLIPCQFTGS